MQARCVFHFFFGVVWLSFVLHYSKAVPLASFYSHYPVSKESLCVPHFIFFCLLSIYWKVMPFRDFHLETSNFLNCKQFLAYQVLLQFFFPQEWWAFSFPLFCLWNFLCIFFFLLWLPSTHCHQYSISWYITFIYPFTNWWTSALFTHFDYYNQILGSQSILFGALI